MKGLPTIPPIIPALRHPEEWEKVLQLGGGVSWTFLLGGALDAVAEATSLLQRRGIHVFVHVDLLRGLSHDQEGLSFLKGYADPAGIISTHSAMINHGNKLGFLTIQRLFLLDSQSIHTGIQQVLSTHSDAVEILPGILPDVTRQMVRQLPCPVIAGGLITTEAEIKATLAAGASAISTSSPHLWSLEMG